MATCAKGERKDGRGRCRNYDKEYREYHGTRRQRHARALRNAARRKMGLKVGDPREVDHIRMLDRGGSNARSNLRVVSRHANRSRDR